MADVGEVLVPSAPVAQPPPEVPYRKLPPGPGMSASEVSTHQRARIHFAMVEIAGEHGYGAVTVRRLAQLASVSTRTFYQHFRDKEECFLCTYDLVVQQAAARIAGSQGADRNWRKRLGRAFDALTGEIERKPRAARLVLLEASGAGPAAIERMRRTEAIFEKMVAESLSDEVQMPPLLVKGVVAGVSGVVGTRLAMGREGKLPELGGELLEWTLSLRDEAVAELPELDRRSVSIGSVAETVTTTTSPGEDGKRSSEGDRPLILTAAAKLAATKGYQQLTVPRIRAAAGVSRRSFHAYFENVEDCFLAALELRVARALERAAGRAAGRNWPDDVYRMIDALCVQIATEPVLAALAFDEIYAAGPTAMRCRGAMTALIAERFRASAPSAQCPSLAAAETSVAAMWGVLRHHATAGSAPQPTRITPSLSYLALAPAIGAAPAMEAIRQGQRHC